MSIADTVSDKLNMPTHFLNKRDPVDENLELYQRWARSCREKDNHLMAHTVDEFYIDDLLMNELANVPIETVKCGKNKAITVTKTTSRRASSTTKAAKGRNQCDDACWDAYLWYTYGDGISVAQGFLGISCMLIGLYLCILGFRFFRPTLALTGFVFIATMTWIGLVNNEPASGYPKADLIYICISAGLGLLGAVFFLVFYQAGLYLLAALGGFYFAVYVLSWKDNLVITIKVARVCFIVGCGILAPFILFFIETYFVLLTTALMGAYLFFFGLDFFAHTGLINPWLLVFDGNPYHHYIYLLRTPIYVILSFIIVLFCLSFGWQYYWNIKCHKRLFGVNPVQVVPEKKEEPKESPKKEPDEPNESVPEPAKVACAPPPACQHSMLLQNTAAPTHCCHTN